MVLDRTDKSVAASRKGFDEPRLVGFVTKCPPQLLDCGIQTMLKIHKRILGPQPLAKRVTGHQLARMLEQNRENPKGLFLQFDFTATLEKLARAQVQSINVKLHHR